MAARPPRQRPGPPGGGDEPDPLGASGADPDAVGDRADGGRGDRSPRFQTTRWSRVLAAGGADDAARDALETLCRAYWYPLYAYARRRGEDTEAAQELVQGFFADLLARRAVRFADPERGRFRSFLLTAFRNHAAQAARRERAAKRGGGRPVLPLELDFDGSEGRFRAEPAHDETPERLFQRDWALAVLAEALGTLRSRYAARGQLDLFEALKGTLTGEAPRPHAELAEELGLQEGAVRTAAHRLRRRYRQELEAAVRQTLAPQDVAPDEELRELLAALDV